MRTSDEAPVAKKNTTKTQPKPVTISILNMKGGVGKTTLAVNLAWHLCRRGRKNVLLIDLDPQFNTSQYTMDYEEWAEHRKSCGTVADLLLDPAKSRMRVKAAKKPTNPLRKYIFEREVLVGGGRLDILPSELSLSAAVKNPHGIAYKLEKHLDGYRDRYDFIFIDCAPTDSILTDTALMASDFVLTPVKPDRFSVLGYAQIQSTFDSFRDSYPDPHHVQGLGVVFTQVQGNLKIEQDSMTEIETQAEYVFAAQIPRSNSYLSSVHQQSPVFDARYCRLVTKVALNRLVKEMQQRIDDLVSE